MTVGSAPWKAVGQHLRLKFCITRPRKKPQHIDVFDPTNMYGRDLAGHLAEAKTQAAEYGLRGGRARQGGFELVAPDGS